MKTSIKEVAKLAGVSVATVSHVLNGTKPVRPQTQERVEKAVDQLNYKVNPVARNLRKGESKLIGFVVSNLANPFYQDVAQGIDEPLQKKGYRALLIDSKEDKQLEIENVKGLLASSVDGLIIAPTTEDFSYLHFLLENMAKKIPAVFLDRRPIGFESDYILASNEVGAYEAVKHLISKGHKEIAFIGSRSDSTMIERLNGYRRALSESSIRINENYIKLGSGISVSQHELRHGISYQQTAELLHDGTKITAMFSGNNLATIGAFTYIREKKLKVPDDVAFVTFDDSFWLTMTTPSISAVAQNAEEMGRVAGEIICQRIQSDQSKETQHLHMRIATRLILRDSC